MPTVAKFEDLIAWQKALELSDIIYSCSDNKHFSKNTALKDEMRRTVISVVSNIAAGCEREDNNQFIPFLMAAKASARELKAQLYTAENRGYISREEFETINSKVLETSKTISGFISYLRSQKKQGVETSNLS